MMMIKLSFFQQNFCRDAEKVARELHVPDQASHQPEQWQRLRWFLLPLEAKHILEKLGKYSAAPKCGNRINIRYFDRI